MNRLSREKQKQIVASLVEGNSIRATCRMTDTAKGTVLKLLADVGKACKGYQDKVLRDLPCKRIQSDEIWSFCYAKAKNVPEEKQGKMGYGDVWTFTALCADTKLIPTWHIGKRDINDATIFMLDLASRMKNRIQLTTDGHNMYSEAVEFAFSRNVDYGQLGKIYGIDNKEGKGVKHNPVRCIDTKSEKLIGNPDPKYVSTSLVERQNLTMRMSMRRVTRRTNGFSKKIENLNHAVALHFMYYNFCRIHQSLRITPAMASGVTDRLWEIEDILMLIK